MKRSPKVAENPSSATLGRFIQHRREQDGLSLRELARRLEMSPAFLSEIERDREFPSVSLRARMATLFGVAPDFLKTLEIRVPFDELRRMVQRSDKLRTALRDIVIAVQAGQIDLEEFAGRLDLGRSATKDRKMAR